MDPNPETFPILSYVMGRLPSLGPKPTYSDIEAPVPTVLSTSQTPPILSQLPRLTDPKLLASMVRAVSDVAQTRSVLQSLGPRPAHETVDTARFKLSEIETKQRPPEMESLDKDVKCGLEDEKEKGIYKAVIQLEEMHADYEKLLKEAEARLVSIYEKAGRGGEEDEEEEDEGVAEEEGEEVDEEVIGVLSEASREKGLERVDLLNRSLRYLPEAIGKIPGLRVLNVSNNQLQMIPDSISGLESLEELSVASNLLEALPDSIGLLYNLKILDVSSNKLEALPDTICHCRSLVELDASFNVLTYLPTNLGYELVNVRRLSIQLNKIRSLPTSICQMRSLQRLEAHFNELNGLPLAIGWLKNLEFLNLSSNFSDLTELPETFGELTNLKELDLSNNQINALPDTFGRLDNLTKLNLDQNPLVIPPVEVVQKGVEAVKNFMAKRWLDLLIEEERKIMLEEQQQTQTGLLTRSTSWLKNYFSGVSTSVSGYLSPRTPQDPYLDQQL